MKLTRLCLFLTLFAAASVATADPVANTYIARGFASRDALLSTLLAMPVEQQETVMIVTATPTDDCGWSDPWVMVYRGAIGDAGGERYDVVTLTPFDVWTKDLLVARGGARARGFDTGDEARPAVVVRWSGPVCVAIP